MRRDAHETGELVIHRCAGEHSNRSAEGHYPLLLHISGWIYGQCACEGALQVVRLVLLLFVWRDDVQRE